MATKGPNEQPSRPDVGDKLIVIREWFQSRCAYTAEVSRKTDYILLADDFQARSSDELSLSKGDRVELIERDDEFGDGWFLGRHLGNENSGLFPEGKAR